MKMLCNAVQTKSGMKIDLLWGFWTHSSPRFLAVVWQSLQTSGGPKGLFSRRWCRGCSVQLPFWDWVLLRSSSQSSLAQKRGNICESCNPQDDRKLVSTMLKQKLAKVWEAVICRQRACCQWKCLALWHTPGRRKNLVCSWVTVLAGGIRRKYIGLSWFVQKCGIPPKYSNNEDHLSIFWVQYFQTAPHVCNAS